MKDKALNWKMALKDFEINTISAAILNNSCIFDIDKKEVYFSTEMAGCVFDDMEEVRFEMPTAEFLASLLSGRAEELEEKLKMLEKGVVDNVQTPVFLSTQEKSLGALIYLFKLGEQPYILGIFHETCSLISETNEKMKMLINQLTKVQTINNLVLEGTTEYIYHVDMRKDQCTVSQQLADLLGVRETTFRNSLETWVGLVVLEDRRHFLDAYKSFVTGETLIYGGEYRIITKGGECRWFRNYGKGMADETGKLILLAGSLKDITQERKEEERRNHILHYDRLTELKNRYCFDKDMEARFLEPDAKGSIVYIDIVNFNMYNEVYGHQFGNLVLKEIARMLERLLPQSLGIYRLDGDEFLIHLRETDKDCIMAELLPLLSCLKQPRVIDEHKFYISTNIGIAIYPQNGRDAEQILKNADIAMYAASKRSKDSVTFFLDSESEELKKRYILENELRHSIQNDFEGFRMVYQPIVDSGTCRWMGAEALLRYHSKIYGDTSVEEVIELLEYTSLILEVGKWVAGKAIRECGKWHRCGLKDSVVHINCSALQVCDEELISCIERELEEQKLEPKYLICELTETALINNVNNGVDFCNTLNSMGIRVALDDFGIGYSSLGYLRVFPIYQIKIDKSFAMQYVTDEYSKIIISTISSLAAQLGILICVEGVENKETYIELRKLQIEQIQGYFFGKPLETEQFLEQLLELS